MDSHHRLKQVRNALGLSQGQLAEKIGRKQGSVSDIERGRNSIDGIVQLLKLTFRVNPDWLREGQGKMFLPSGYETGPKKPGVPYYETGVTDTGKNFPQVSEPPEYYVDFRPFNDCTAYFPHYGDSMSPRYQNGDIIAVRQVRNLDVILWGEAYLVITDEATNGLKVLRLLMEHENKDKVILRALNPDFSGDMVIGKESIVSLHLVKGRITVMA